MVTLGGVLFLTFVLGIKALRRMCELLRAEVGLQDDGHTRSNDIVSYTKCTQPALRICLESTGELLEYDLLYKDSGDLP